MGQRQWMPLGRYQVSVKGDALYFLSQLSFLSVTKCHHWSRLDLYDAGMDRRWLVLRMTEIVEVTETVTIFIENDALKDSEADVVVEEAALRWVQLEFTDLLMKMPEK